MAITSVGYDGTVTDNQWATLAPSVGVAKYGVAGYSDWRPTIGGAGTRPVTIAAGSGWGYGVRDTNSAPVTLNLSSVPSGNRWDLIVANRNWGTSTTTFAVVEGGSAKQIPARENTPGTEDEQPIALARVAAGSSTVQELVDLRVQPSTGGAVAHDPLALQYLSEIGSVIRIGDTEWTRKSDAGTPTWSSVDVADTGWLTNLTVNYGAHFGQGASIRMRKDRGWVNGRFVVIKNSSSTFSWTVNAAHELCVTGTSTATSLTVMRLLGSWVPNQEATVEIRELVSKRPWWGTVDSEGLVSITHGIPGASITTNLQLVVFFDHRTA